MEYTFEEIEFCECVGEFDDEYVYDIEVDDDSHTFIANDILVHNSLYLSYYPLLRTIKGIDKMSIAQKRDIIAHINTDFLDRHNEEYIREYYNTRYGKSVHNFELETINLSGVWLNVKKRYGQILLWKDGHSYDVDDLPMKIKGLEVVKSSFPSKSRALLKRLLRFLLEHASDRYLSQEINIEAQKCKQEFMTADIDEVSGSVKVNNYDKYILDDSSQYLKTTGRCPWNARALGLYNQLRNYYHLEGDPLYGGKVKWYITTNSSNKSTEYFAYQSHNWPKWAKQYANIDRIAMFEQTVLDPLNRIMETIHMSKINADGSLQASLFDLF